MTTPDAFETDALESRLRRRSNIRFTVVLVLAVLVAAWTVLVTIADGDYEHRDHETGRQCQEDEYVDHNGRCVHLDVIRAGLSAPAAVHPPDPLPEQVESAYHAHMRAHVPGARGWPTDWMDDFAADVCEALDTWPGEYPAADIARALVEQWDWEPDPVGVAVNAAAAEACPEYAPLPAGRLFPQRSTS